MTVTEFSYEFDILFNNIASNDAPGLNEYEKSVFLTKAQNEIVKAFFSPIQNKPMKGFNDSELRDIDFSMLIREVTCSVTAASSASSTAVGVVNVGSKTSGMGYIYLPSDIMMAVNQFVSVTNTADSTRVQLAIEDIEYYEFQRLSKRPYKRPARDVAWKIVVPGSSYHGAVVVSTGSYTGSDGNTYASSDVTEVDGLYYVTSSLSDGSVVSSSIAATPATTTTVQDVPSGVSVSQSTRTALIIGAPNDTLNTYYLRYVKRPSPIVLANFGTEASVEGVSAAQTCELDEEIHPYILQRAVEMALATYGDSNVAASMVQLGSMSQTPVGMPNIGGQR